MHIAIPVKTDNENPALASLFGKAKWFAIVKDGSVNIEKNQAKGGKAVIEWLKSSGIDTIIFQEMGTTPYEMIKSVGDIDLYHAGEERIELADVLAMFQDNKLKKVDDQMMAEIIKKHESRHTHDHKGHH